jgi:hypothetical protein
MTIGKMAEITEPEHLEILIRKDGLTVWINTQEKPGDLVTCSFRACRIKNLILNDERQIEDQSVAMKVTVNFKKGIRTDGEISWVRIEQSGSEISLTAEQAITLMKQLHRKFRPLLNEIAHIPCKEAGA